MRIIDPAKRRFKVYFVWPFEPEHTVHGAPVQITVHTRRWILQLRPFSGFGQGGDRRGENDWRAWDSAGRPGDEPHNPYRNERAARWVLADEDPEIWRTVRERRGTVREFLTRRGAFTRCRHRREHWPRLRSCIWGVEYARRCAKHADYTRQEDADA